MSKVLVECRWRILKFDLDDFRDMLRLAAIHECDLWLKEERSFVDGYQVISILVSAEAEEIVDLFREAIQRYADLSQGRPAKLSQDLTSLGGQSIRSLDVRYFFESAALHNQTVRDHRPIWITASWVIKPVLPTVLGQMAERGRIHKLLMTYQIRRLVKSEVQFFIEFLHPYEFIAHMTEFKKIMTLRQWSVMFDPQSYKAIDYDKIEAYPHLSHDTIPAFLEAIKPYL